MSILLTNDDQLIPITHQAIQMSIVLSEMLNDCNNGDDPIQVPNVDGETAQLLVKFCQFYVDHKGKHQREAFNRDFFRGMDPSKLAQLSAAANYLDISILMDLAVKNLAKSITKR